ncbi:MAG: SpoIIE family protein phosphatase, partial [Bacteroidetes bacterium]|nr:SpoIIE family protein phosphatase [Bacteroidota bacterium]
RREKVIRYSVMGGLALMFIIAAIIFRSLRITRKQKNIIELQKNEVSRQKEMVEQQKKIVEEHQKEIIDSITYAKRLQEALLPPTDYVNKHLPENFILYKPKDIVAGDFYWMEYLPPSPSLLKEGAQGVVFIAAADCTGHGVPGAMVSVVCSNALNRAVKEFHLRETGKILDKVTELVLETFEKSDKDVKDGMDISLLSIQFPSPSERDGRVRLNWSGANNPLLYIPNPANGGTGSEAIEVAADKQPVGKHDNRKPFTTNTISYQPDTIFYLFTDGYADQFGGAKGKKFMYRKMQAALVEINKKPMDEQKKILDETIMQWKGSNEQVDDICVIGIRI